MQIFSFYESNFNAKYFIKFDFVPQVELADANAVVREAEDHFLSFEWKEFAQNLFVQTAT